MATQKRGGVKARATEASATTPWEGVSFYLRKNKISFLSKEKGTSFSSNFSSKEEKTRRKIFFYLKEKKTSFFLKEGASTSLKTDKERTKANKTAGTSEWVPVVHLQQLRMSA